MFTKSSVVCSDCCHGAGFLLVGNTGPERKAVYVARGFPLKDMEVFMLEL